MRAAQSRFSRNAPRTAGEEIFWALNDVSFEIDRGEVVGVIGRNGAGKSTLLKILSRITDPTVGRGEIHGRVGSLLEVGTGFHPELTGRENIYLSGAILGMKKAEIERKFDEIVSFAEVERFVDTMVKYYSSGMYLRLGFAVAAHLEPEILLVDEVLAVGDAAFQRKCLGKMGAVANEGRTVLFVSHSMDAIRRLCPTVLWIDSGKVQYYGPSDGGIASYLLSGVRRGGSCVFEIPHQLRNGLPVVLHAVRLLDQDGQACDHFSARSPIRVEIDWESYASVYKLRIGFVLQTSDGTDVLTSLDATSWAPEWIGPGARRSSCSIPAQLLNEGEYVIDIGADGPSGFDFTRSRTGCVLRFEVEDDMTLPNKYYGQEGFRDERWRGVLLLDIPWTQEEGGLVGTGNG